MSNYEHKTVLLGESLAALAIKPEGYYLDCTLGGGGHSLGILEAAGGRAYVAGIDRDDWALEAATERLTAAGFGSQFQAIKGSFSNLAEIRRQLNWPKLDGLIADLGFSSAQIDSATRGFSYLQEGPLDMRMDQSQELTAAMILSESSENELRRIFKDYGEEPRAASLARLIVKQRAEEPLETTTQLASLIARNLPARERREKNPARRVFQALRIAVNAELSELEKLLEQLPAQMASQGRVAIISFHSLEAGMVRRAFREYQDPCHCPKQLPCNCGLESLGEASKVVYASAAEIADNPRARSAQLRAFCFK